MMATRVSVIFLSRAGEITECLRAHEETTRDSPVAGAAATSAEGALVTQLPTQYAGRLVRAIGWIHDIQLRAGVYAAVASSMDVAHSGGALIAVVAVQTFCET